ncbi:MAG TPA: hypothetical protein VMX58_02375 [Patescibacteria group bacterium]|nr:hypothetical protein [Patescibacteria group bacterium]
MKKLFAASLFLLIALVYGCRYTADDPTSPGTVPDNQPATVVDLDAPTGGFSFADEDPVFGESEIFQSYDNEPAYDDPYREQERVREMERRHGARIYRFRAVWGHLARAFDDSTTAERCPIDWTGTLHVEGGVIIIEKVIAFEAADSVTRIDKSTIGWVSHTGPHVDGIQVKLVCPPPSPPDGTSNGMPEPVLVFETGPYTARFTPEQLMSLNIVQPVDRCGNGISINSHIILPSCPRGHLMGGWKSVEPDTIISPDSTGTRGVVHGVFRGIWIGRHGYAVGHLKGVYGVNSAGERVFFGKYIDEDGRFMSILRGHYGAVPAIDAGDACMHGWFEGVWLGKDLVMKGRLKGHWAADEPGVGFFHGVWGMNCSGVW